mmetsp:Transcript_129302/g.361909  ORF Transcript_129302/g.361909 Transcript_129302/m.361909 type:complete len:203 (-) Transcript_129302:949-1557(-)
MRATPRLWSNSRILSASGKLLALRASLRSSMNFSISSTVGAFGPGSPRSNSPEAVLPSLFPRVRRPRPFFGEPSSAPDPKLAPPPPPPPPPPPSPRAARGLGSAPAPGRRRLPRRAPTWHPATRCRRTSGERSLPPGEPWRPATRTRRRASTWRCSCPLAPTWRGGRAASSARLSSTATWVHTTRRPMATRVTRRPWRRRRC